MCFTFMPGRQPVEINIEQSIHKFVTEKNPQPAL